MTIIGKGNNMQPADNTQADGYYDEDDMGKDELDLSFLNDEDNKK